MAGAISTSTPSCLAAQRADLARRIRGDPNGTLAAFRRHLANSSQKPGAGARMKRALKAAANGQRVNWLA